MQLSSRALTELFTVPADDWTAINQRVGMVLFAKSIAGDIEKELTGFGALEDACQAWAVGTFQSLIDASEGLGAYAASAIQDFSALNEAVRGLVGDTVPAIVQQQTAAALSRLQSTTLPLVSEFADLSQKVTAFMNLNRQIDAELDHARSVMGLSWASVASIAQAIDSAVGLVNGAFQAIYHDLLDGLSISINVTLPFLEGLDLGLAIQTWARIQVETSAFAALAAAQKQYWAGPPGG